MSKRRNMSHQKKKQETTEIGDINDRFKSEVNHDKAYELYAESVTNPAAFPSVKCVNPNCSDYRIAYMGDPTTLPTNTQDQGSYYLRTNANSPYGQGNIFHSLMRDEPYLASALDLTSLCLKVQDEGPEWVG
ncbi:hypothetical protein AAG570_003947 [Ranatra chinensis]|uniref:Uncharacterized protein n=1 Tax=Ranatra chinensis TaxID=642074 RepID=A0ABD0Y2D3_9HEMI